MLLIVSIVPMRYACKSSAIVTSAIKGTYLLTGDKQNTVYQKDTWIKQANHKK